MLLGYVALDSSNTDGGEVPRMIPVLVVVAESARAAVDSAMSEMGLGEAQSIPSPIIVVAANATTAERGGFAQIVKALLAAPDREVNVAVPEPFPRAVWRRIARQNHRGTPVALGPSAVQMPKGIVGAATIVAVNDLRGEPAERPVIVLGIWSRFAGLKARVGVRVSPPEQGPAAEIALAVRPSLVLLADRWHERSLVVATADQIAAELVGLAIRQAMRNGDDEDIRPWQDPVVQRATELDLGVRIPDQIAIRARSIGNTAETTDDLRALLADVAARLGVRDSGVDRFA